ncbi:ABC transporter substrate-binding protein [Natrialbaceae archaeon GCM10025810]|uniref:ABC transporter substrate-binding protein n=1 Tax=Halovalidus salilacus TaxID=3075124 RepID=UPI0036148801
MGDNNRGREARNGSSARANVGIDRRSFVKTTAAGASIAAFAGCLGGGGGGGDTVRLGALYIQSGFASLYGEEAERGFDLAVDEINDDGGIDGKDVEVVVRDTEGDSETGISQMRSLVEEENVDGLFGLDSSGVAQAVAPQVEQYQIPLMVTHAGTPFLTSPEGEHEKSVGNDYVFRASNSVTHDMYGAARIASELDVTDWATIGPNYAFGEETWDYFRAFMDGLDVEANWVTEQFPELASNDFSSDIDAVLGEEPEAVITPLWGSDLTTFLGQAEDAGWFDEIEYTLFSVGMGTDLPADGSPLPEGEYASTRYDPFEPDSEENETFRETYWDEYETLPTYNAEGAYRAVYLYKEAIEAAGGANADDLVDQFTGMEHSGPVGEYRFDEETNQATVASIWGTVSYSDEWESNVLDPVEYMDVEPQELRDLLEGSDLPAGA